LAAMTIPDMLGHGSDTPPPFGRTRTPSKEGCPVVRNRQRVPTYAGKGDLANVAKVACRCVLGARKVG
jgi:hypothetical protein